MGDRNVSTFEPKYDEAVRKWLGAKVGVPFDRISNVTFTAGGGCHYSSYTYEDDTCEVSYTVADIAGKKSTSSYEIEGMTLGSFVAEVCAYLI